MKSKAGLRDCEIVIGANLIDRIGSIIAKQFSRNHCAIISDTNVAPIFGERAKNSLTNAAFHPILITTPAGEQFKTLEQAGKICDEMIAAELDRHSSVVGLGGGLVGDISA